MAETTRCPVCGADNPTDLERCRACNQLLEQSTKELGGFGERIASGETPTQRRTSELEKNLPAWLRRARQSDQDENKEDEENETPPEETAPSTKPEPEAVEEPVMPDFSMDDDEDADPADWLAGLSESADDDDDEEVADWLVNLQEADVSEEQIPAQAEELSEASFELPEELPEAQADQPDLTPATDAIEPVEESLPGEDGVPDWLSRLSDEAENAPETPAVEPAPELQQDAQPQSADADESLPDWISDLQAVGDISAETPAPETDDDTAASFDLPQDIPEEPAPEESDEADDAVEAEIPDWLASMQGSEESPSMEEIVAPASDDLPDWLTGDEPVAETSESMAASGDLPDWLSADDDAGETPSPAMDAGDLPDWLSGEDALEAESTPVEEDAPIPAMESSDLPGWISDDEDDVEEMPEEPEQEDQEYEEAPTPAMAAGDLPDWLSEPQTDGDETEEEAPEWLAGGEEPEVEETSAASSPFEKGYTGELSSSDLPDWMADLGSADQTEEEALEAEIPMMEASSQEGDTPSDDELPKAEPGDIPDWMSELGSADQAEEESLGAEAPVAEAGSQEDDTPSDDELPEAESGDIPDWLSRVGKPTTGSLSMDDVDSDDISPALEAADEAPDWLGALPGIDNLKEDDAKEEIEDSTEEPAPAASASSVFVDENLPVESAEDEIFGIDMPDWLSNLAPEDLELGGEETQDAAQPASGESEDLSGAELPSWVQAMRPVESVVSDSDGRDEQLVADSGPLAGLNGILPAGTGIQPRSKPQSHALKLQVSESQQSSAKLLESILNGESEPAERSGKDAPGSIPILRWLIAGLMLFIVSAALLLPQGTALTALPQFSAPETRDTIGAIQSLPADGTVLVIFDYEAALSGELQAAAAPVVDHIMLRGQKLALLSSTPNGSALGERFLTETQSSHNYQSGSDYVNLGYLPGGATGMLSFITSPRTAVRGELKGEPYWTLAPLMDIQQITDFSSVLILTDDVEKGRAWIEQGAATLNDASTPFLMVVSAQAEPVIYPYFASGQIDGLVSGLNGGAMYESFQGQYGLGRKYWDAYSLGLLTAEILIVIGAAINFIAGLRARQKFETEEE